MLGGSGGREEGTGHCVVRGPQCVGRRVYIVTLLLGTGLPLESSFFIVFIAFREERERNIHDQNESLIAASCKPITGD